MIREIRYKISADTKSIEPKTRQWAGMQYEDNATEVVFDISAIAEVMEISAARIDFDSSAAGYHPSENLTVDTNGILRREIPKYITQYGGELQVTAVITVLDENDNQTGEVLSWPVIVYFTAVERSECGDETVEGNISAIEANVSKMYKELQTVHLSAEEIVEIKEDTKELITEIKSRIVVGESTEDGGEIFNDYENNIAIGGGASARGLNTRAGNKAFKILQMEYGSPEYLIDKFNGNPVTTVDASEDFNISEGETIKCYLAWIDIFEWGLDLVFAPAGSDSIYFSTGLENSYPEGNDIISVLESEGIVQGRNYYITFTNIHGTGNDLFATMSKVVYKPDDNNLYITVRGDVTSGETPYVADDLVQIACKIHFNNCFKIADISITDEGNSNLTLIRTDHRGGDPQNLVLAEDDADNAKNWLYVAGKNNGEICPQLTSAFSAGKNSIAAGYASVSFGRDNISSGNYAATFGRENIGAYASLVAGAYSEAGNAAAAIGQCVKALGNSSVATGVNTFAKAASSRAGGRDSQAISEFAVAEGRGIKGGLKQGQVAHGNYNVRSDTDLFIIGDGTADDNRHNAFEITEDYKVLLNGGKLQLLDNGDGPKTLNYPKNISTGKNALATGKETTASGDFSFAGGVGSQATARSAVALGEYNKATKQGGFAGGVNAEANGIGSVALGYFVNTRDESGQIAIGKYNEAKSSALFMVGNGTKDKRSNAFEVLKDGSAKIANALIITDNTTGKDYKVYISDGKLQLEEV